MFIDVPNRSLRLKIVYYGPGLCGKTTNLQHAVEFVNARRKRPVDLVSVATEDDRTVFFDYLPLSAKPISGFTPTFQIYTVPGQVQYNRTRLLVLGGVDGIVFVVDSQRPLLRANQASWQELQRNLRELSLDPAEIPLVVQYNKQDLPTALLPKELERKLGLGDYRGLPAVASQGTGVMETLRAISGAVVHKVKPLIERSRPENLTQTTEPDVAQSEPAGGVTGAVSRQPAPPQPGMRPARAPQRDERPVPSAHAVEGRRPREPRGTQPKRRRDAMTRPIDPLARGTVRSTGLTRRPTQPEASQPEPARTNTVQRASVGSVVGRDASSTEERLANIERLVTLIAERSQPPAARDWEAINERLNSIEGLLLELARAVGSLRGHKGST